MKISACIAHTLVVGNARLWPTKARGWFQTQVLACKWSRAASERSSESKYTDGTTSLTPKSNQRQRNVYLCHHAEVLVACYLKRGLFSVCFPHLALSSPPQELCKRNTERGSAAQNSSKAPAASDGLWGSRTAPRPSPELPPWERSRRALRYPDRKATDKAAGSAPRAGAEPGWALPFSPFPAAARDSRAPPALLKPKITKVLSPLLPAARPAASWRGRRGGLSALPQSAASTPRGQDSPGPGWQPRTALQGGRYDSRAERPTGGRCGAAEGRRARGRPPALPGTARPRRPHRCTPRSVPLTPRRKCGPRSGGVTKRSANRDARLRPAGGGQTNRRPRPPARRRGEC